MTAIAERPPLDAHPLRKPDGVAGLDKDGEPSDVLSSYLHQLLADYRLVPQDHEPNSPARKMIEDMIAQRQDKDWTWDDVYAIEKGLVLLDPPERLRRRLWALEEEYQQIGGPKVFAAYIACRPRDLDKAAPEVLRAELMQLMSEVQWLYSTVWVQDNERDLLSARLMLGSLILLGVPSAFLLIGLYMSERTPPVPTLPIVFLCGALGGLVSTLRRISSMPLEGNPAVNLFALARNRITVYLSPLAGAIFAGVLFVLLIAGLVKGDLFPDIYSPKLSFSEGPAPSRTSIEDFLRHTGPVNGIDYAKLMIWSFLAGFAERLVPDTLNRLTARGDEAQAKPRNA